MSPGVSGICTAAVVALAYGVFLLTGPASHLPQMTPGLVIGLAFIAGSNSRRVSMLERRLRDRE
jgi:hypothetical protein